MKKILYIFILSFVLNYIWENLHSVLYVNYQGGEITQSILLHATLVDAFILTPLIIIVSLLFQPKYHAPLIFTAGVIIAIGIETWALDTNRWLYSSAMPIIPIIKTGLTPTIQLGLTGLCTYYLTELLITLSSRRN